MIKLVRSHKIMSNQKQTHVIVIGNEKGGSGKTTTSMHVIMCLIKLGYNVGSLDLDSRQQSLSRYLENRHNYSNKHNVSLPASEHYFIPRALGKETVDAIEQDEHDRFITKLNYFKENKDFVVIDTPGSNTFLARLAHSYADSVITPINDSFIDFDLLARIDPDDENIVRPSLYSEMVWNQRMVRAQRDGEKKATDWVVLCNRLSHLDAKNKRRIFEALQKLADRIGFRVIAGVTERVVYRELFPKGLTVMDILDQDLGIKTTMSHLTARAEIRDLVKNLKIERLSHRVNEIIYNEEITNDNEIESFTDKITAMM